MITQPFLAVVTLKGIVPANQWVGLLKPDQLGYNDVPNDRTVVVAVVDVDNDAAVPSEAATAQVVGHLRRGGITAEVVSSWARDVGATPLASAAGKDEPFAPNWSCSPGDTLQEWLEDRGLTAAQLASSAGIDAAMIGGILAGLTPVTEMVAESIAKATGTSTALWLRLESQYSEGLARELRVDGVAPRATPDLQSARSVGHVGAQWLSFAHRQLQQRIGHPEAPGVPDLATIAQAIALGNAFVSLSASLDRGGWNGW